MHVYDSDIPAWALAAAAAWQTRRATRANECDTERMQVLQVNTGHVNTMKKYMNIDYSRLIITSMGDCKILQSNSEQQCDQNNANKK
jgi:ATP-dependent phosphoenolpyruvate carboxykinase